MSSDIEQLKKYLSINSYGIGIRSFSKTNEWVQHKSINSYGVGIRSTAKINEWVQHQPFNSYGNPLGFSSYEG